MIAVCEGCTWLLQHECDRSDRKMDGLRISRYGFIIVLSEFLDDAK